MWRFIIFLSLLSFLAISVVDGQTPGADQSKALLDELGGMLKQTPTTGEECQALYDRIKSWQDQWSKKLTAQSSGIAIIEPKEGDSIPERPFIRGSVADPNAKVWVIVHPTEVSDYYVQPIVSVKKDGKWQVSVYIGRSGNVDRGKHFEIMAVANPKTNISEGQVLKGWPDAEMKSDFIEVIRK